jgi:hypothetical protein
MAGTARGKRLGALALLAILLVPAPFAAAQERPSEKEWVWGEWGDGKVRAQREHSEAERGEGRERKRQRRAEKERDTERRARKQLLRRTAREQQKSKSGNRDRYESKYKYKFKYESKYKYEAKYKYKYEAKGKSKDKGKYKGRDHHHGHQGYGLVYGSHRDRPRRYRPRPYYRPPPRPHPCDFWDDDWFRCGGRPPSILERHSSYVVHLIGAPPGSPGPPDTSGVAGLALVRDLWGNGVRICYRLSLRGPAAGAPLRAHVHDAGQPNEPEVVDFGPVRDGGRACRNVRSRVLRDIERDPNSFYFDVHFGTISPGAVRGQLVRVYDD